MHLAFIHAGSRGGADDTPRRLAATLRAEGHEATAHGFHPVIPGVNDRNRSAFKTFTAGLAV